MGLKENQSTVLRDEKAIKLALEGGSSYENARALEIGLLYREFLHQNWMFHFVDRSGLIIDAGTGSGPGALVARSYDYLSRIIAVDKNKKFKDDQGYWISGGAYNIPNWEMIEAARAEFVRADIVDYLATVEASSVKILTLFYTAKKYWQVIGEEFLAQAGRVLIPGGQVLITADMPLEVNPINWGSVCQFLGKEGPEGKSLWLPVEQKLIPGMKPIVERTGVLMESNMDEIRQIMGVFDGRDSWVWLGTKPWT